MAKAKYAGAPTGASRQARRLVGSSGHGPTARARTGARRASRMSILESPLPFHLVLMLVIIGGTSARR